MTEGVVEYLLLVAKVEHDVPVKLVSQGRPNGLDVSDVITDTGLVSFTLPDEKSHLHVLKYTNIHTDQVITPCIQCTVTSTRVIEWINCEIVPFCLWVLLWRF